MLWNEMTAKELIDNASHVAVLTGAGISTDSGIADFKSTDESWPYEEPRDVLISAPYWRARPEHFWEVYRYVFGSKISSESLVPSGFHRWLAELESSKPVSIITQNVDGLHGLAGSTDVIEAHGNSSRAICIVCRETVPMSSIAEVKLPLCSSDQCFGKRLTKNPSVLKPDVSLFFEGISGMGEFRRKMEQTDLLIVAGTRLQVGPINEIPYYATGKPKGKLFQPTLWLNDEEPPQDYSFTKTVIGTFSEILKTIG